MTESRMTLVTCLFDLAVREGNPRRRTPADYLRDGEFLIELDKDIVFFADPELGDEIGARRRARGLGARTAVVPTTLEEMPRFAAIERIRQARERNPVLNANPDKDTPLYVALTWSKFTMVERALSLDPFSATHFAWIDLGIAHVAQTWHAEEDRVFSRAAEKVRLLMMRSFTPEELADPGSYYAYLRGHLAAGFVTASRSSFARFCGLFDAEARSALDLGYGPSEEQILPVICARNPDLFEFYYGDYPAILENARVLRDSGENLLFQSRHCRAAGDFRRGCDIGAQVLSGHRDRTFQTDAATLSALLDEYFIAAYYLEHPAQTTARQIAVYYAALTRGDPAFRAAFRRDRDHIRQNFGVLADPIGL